ncbi:LOW QUALITY PROTEIN: coiled-coil domain-containing protein 30 [Pseudonaja textilis]|uniref:LOW QUALITY PROTEIN: coiled-coil domain-containing protein 30 n=1 Tax=Pseudonaja textilis TaxID=8673 RepID=UPI000EAA1D02|nr:LOW QUALITY PROTEIN: coiled-coil domain-containing protein 30 [Pseudonaja textilis]
MPASLREGTDLGFWCFSLFQQLGEAEGGGDAAATTTATTAPSETQLAHAWPWFLRGPEDLHSASGALLRQQLEEEMREVQNYVDHVRALTEARDALAAEYERENEELRTKFTQMQLEHESQHKEVAELLALEGLAGIVHSSPSEQVAYLLVERSSLLERMEALEQELGAPHRLGRPCGASLQDEWHLFHPRTKEEFHQLQQSLHHIEGTVSKGEKKRNGAENWPGSLGKEEERGEQPVEPLARPSLPREPFSALDPDSGTAASELWKAREQNLPTDRLLLHDRLCFPEAERWAPPGGLSASREAASDLGGSFKHELRSSKAELLRLYGELQVLQGATEERGSLRLAHEKLLQENGRLEAKVLELSHECERLNQRLLREREEEEEEEDGGVLASRLSCPEFPARVKMWEEDQMPDQGADGQPVCLPFSEASRMAELEKPVQAQQREEGPFREGEILAVQRQLSAHRERRGAAAPPSPPRPGKRRWGHGAGVEGGPPRRERGSTPPFPHHLPSARRDPPRKEPRTPQEEAPGLLWAPRQAPISTKKQLRLEQERTLELRLQNLQLQQENLKVQAELRQAQGKLREASRACGALASRGELSQQQAKELELQLLQLSQAAKQQSRLREQLTQESQRAAQAEKRVEELERRLQESRQLSEPQAALGRRELEEEQKMRELLEREEQQRRLWREKEAQLLRALADRQAQVQQQEGKLQALEEERRVLAKVQLHCQGQSQRLSEQLSALQREKEALCEEQRQVLRQVDLSLRKQSERRLRHKVQLRQVKERLLGEVKLRDSRIRHLENEVRLCKSQAEKDQLLIQRVTSENESLLREKRKSLEQLHSLEEAKQSRGQALCTLQSRVQLLEGENRQLQDRVLQLSLQVGILERALRTIHVHSLEELKSLGFPDCPLQRKLLPFPSLSFSVTRLSDPSRLRQAIKDGQPAEPGQKALLSPLAFQTPRIGCVDVPRNLPDFREDEPGHPVG